MTINFITFGSHDNYIDAANRLKNQAEELNIFDMIKVYTPDDLKEDDEFWNKHQDFIENNRRLYGYALWKPYIIHKTIQTLNDGDILLYLDCGCELIINEKDHILMYINECINKYKLFLSITPEGNEKRYCKMDLLHKLKINNDPIILNTHQFQSGFIFLEVNISTRFLINEWYNLASNDYHNIDDSPSIIPNISEYIEHRHDQSILSLLIKKYDIQHFSIDQWKLRCIRYARNRTGISKCINGVFNF
jgi:hypothetical protein